MQKTVNLKLVADYTPAPDPPASNAEIYLLTTNISVDESTSFSFNVFRAIRTDQVIDVDWAFVNATVTPISGTIRFGLGITTVITNVTSGEVDTDELGTLILSNPRVVSGPTATPVLVSPFQTSVAIANVSSYTTTFAELRALGYVLPEDFGAKGDNSTDDYNAIQEAVQYGYDWDRPVWFSGGKTYVVSKSIMCFKFPYSGVTGNPTHKAHAIYGGGGEGTSLAKAKIRLKDGSYTNENDPKPVFCFRNFRNNNGAGTYPSDPMFNVTYVYTTNNQADYSPWIGMSSNFFWQCFGNIDIDCGNNAGAFGVYFPAAQSNLCYNITIDASNAVGGWHGLLGRNQCVTNLKVIGGKWQIKNDSRNEEGSAGSIVAGLTLIGDSRTVTPIETDDFVPLVIVGFDITQTKAIPIITSHARNTSNQSAHEAGTYCLIDGIIRTTGGIAIDNNTGLTVHIRNVYVNGAASMVRDPGNTFNCSGTWSRVNSYAYSDTQTITYTGDVPGDRTLVNIQNGSINTNARPFASFSTNTGAPSVDYVARHTTQFPHVDWGPYNNIDDFGAVSNDPNFLDDDALRPNTDHVYVNNTTITNSRAAIQNAIDDAEAQGHNRVFIPRGAYFVGSPGVKLKPNTIVMGCGPSKSFFASHGSWLPTSVVFLVESADDLNGSAHMSNVGFSYRTKVGPGSDLTSYDNAYFSGFRWRTGKNSSTAIPMTNPEFTNPDCASKPRYYYYFSNSAGGKHYSLCGHPPADMNNPSSNTLRITGTNQPLHVYGHNSEIPKKTPYIVDSNTLIVNAQNVRIYGSKREGDSRTIEIRDSQNVAFYGLGRQTTDDIVELILISGASDKILIGPVFTDATSDNAGTSAKTILQDIDGVANINISYPYTMIGVYQYGNIDDSLVEI